MSEEQNIRLPSANTLQHAAKICIVEDRPIMLDYWTLSLEKKVLINKKRLLQLQYNQINKIKINLN